MLTPDRRDHPTLIAALLPWLRARMPEADRIELPSVRKPDGGGSSETYFVSPAIDGRVVEWVLRIQATDNQIYRDPSVERQYRVMAELGRTRAAPVPAMLWYEPDAAILGAPFFLMERVAGEVPSAFYHSDGYLTTLDASSRRTLWLSAIEAMARVHAADPAPFAFLAGDAPDTDAVGRELAVWQDYARWSEAPPRDVQARALDRLLATRPAATPPGLAWGDARIGNMVLDGTRCAAVIDWETASLAGAETDLGWWLFYDWVTTDGIGAPRLPGIGDRAAFVAAWEGFSGRRVAALDWHELFATWRFSLVSDQARELARRRDPDGPIASNRRNFAAERLEMLLAS